MSRPMQSLALRLVLGATGVQIVCFVIGLMVFPLVAPFTTYRQMADGSVRRHVLASLVHEPDGSVKIAPTKHLSDYAIARPTLRYAVRSADGRYLEGSSPELISILRRIGPFVPRHDDTFETVRPGRPADAVFVTSQNSAFGPLVIATTGDSFRLADVPSFFDKFLPAILPVYGPVLLGVLFGMPWAVRRMFRPLNDAVRAAALINVYSLYQRLPEKRLPSEFEPLVVAINASLDRLDEGWTRQKLFTANAAHELRTPVAVLQARVETLPDHAPLRAALNRDVRRIGILIDQLLAIARLERRETVLRPIELVSLIRDLVADWAPVAVRSNVAIGFAADADAIWVLGEARALESAVAALIDNALKVEPENKSVGVRVTSAASVFVSDHGPGIDSDDQQAAFEPFWRKDALSSGSGLGLATVEEAARLHGGHARVMDHSGGGAVFELFIPRIAPPV